MKQPIFTIENNSFYIEDIFVEYDGPVFFMCKDKYNARYFVEAGPSNEKEAQWVLVKASDNRINDALNNKITLYDLFRNAEEESVLLITTSSTLVDSSEYVPASQVSDALLPSPGYYLDADRDPTYARKSNLVSRDEAKEKNYYPAIDVTLFFKDDNKHSVEVTQAANILLKINELRQSLALDRNEKNISQSKKKQEPALLTDLKAGSLVFVIQGEELSITNENSFSYLYDLLTLSDDNAILDYLKEKSPAVPKRYVQLMASVINAEADLGLTYIPISSVSQFTTKIDRDELARRIQLLKNSVITPDSLQLHGKLFGYDQNKRTFSFLPDEFDPNEDQENTINELISGSVDSVMYESNLTSEIKVNSMGKAYITKEVILDINQEKSKYTLTSFIQD